MSNSLSSSSLLSLLTTLFLTIVHLLAGFCILLVASWFIAACSIAGLGFNYMLPAVIIRALAIIRIGSGYFSMLVGHHHLLSQLARIRLSIFASLENKISVSREASLDALHHQSEEVASIWIAWVGQNAGAFLSLLSFNLVTLFMLPVLSHVVLALSASFIIIYTVLLWSMLRTSAAWVVAKKKMQFELLQHIEAASLWHLYSSYDSQASKLQKLNLLANAITFRIRFASLCLFVVSIIALTAILSVYSVQLGGNALFVLVPIALLSINDWLSPTLQNQKQLINFTHAKQAIKSITTELQPLREYRENIAGFTLQNFKPANTNTKSITATFNTNTVHLIKGSSGAGKSRFLQAINGTLPFEGTKELLAANSSTSNTALSQYDLLSDCFYVQQFPYILSDTLRCNLQIANSQATDCQLNEVLKSVGLSYLTDLDQWLGDNGRLLSGGEKKRIGLARALLCKAGVILMDEPFEALDDRNVELLAVLINKLAMNKLILLATHIAPQVLNISQTVTIEPLNAFDENTYSSEEALKT